MWYEGLEVLWDGGDRLALRLSPGRPKPSGSRTLLVQSQRDGSADPGLIAVLADFADPTRMHAVRLPSEHRSLRLSFETGEPEPLSLTLSDTLAEGPGTDRRLVFLSLAAGEGEDPTFHSATTASLHSFRRFYEQQLSELRGPSDPPERVLLWGTRYLQCLRPEHWQTQADLIVSPSVPIFPEGTYVAPIEIEMPAPASRRRRDWDGARLRSDAAPYMPAVARAIRREAERHPEHRYGLRLRTSRENPTTLWFQRRSAVIHVRHQARAAARTEDERGEPEHFVSLPLRNLDLLEIRFAITGRVPDEDGFEDDRTLVAHNLFDLLENGGDAAESVIVTLPESDADSEPDEVQLEFANAALGDDIGIASTQATIKMLKVESTGTPVQPTDVVMFNVTADGLSPFEVPATYRDELLAAAAAVQPHDRPYGLPLATVRDEPGPPADDARAVLEGWAARRLGSEPIPFRFDALEPVPTLVALPLIAQFLDPAEIRPQEVIRALEFHRRDPAVCALLVKHGLARGWRSAPATQDMSRSLVARLAAAIHEPGLVDDEGVLPAAEAEALRIIVSEPDLRRKLVQMRVALDASTDALGADIESVQPVFADDAMLARFAESNVHRPDATRVEAYRSRRETGAWTPLKEVAELTGTILAWKARSDEIDRTIAAINTETIMPAVGSASSGTPRQIRDEIRAILDKAAAGSPVKDNLDIIAGRFDLDELDLPQLKRLHSKVATLAFGQENERLIDSILVRLEEWAQLPGFFGELGGSDAAGQETALLRRKGAGRFVERAQKMYHWTVPRSGNDEFTKTRIALSEKLTQRRNAEIGQADAPDGDFQRFVVPAADQFLHHRVFRALKALVGDAEKRQAQAPNIKIPSLVRKVRRGLAAWPHQAASHWASGDELARRLGVQSISMKLSEALELPDFT